MVRAKFSVVRVETSVFGPHPDHKTSKVILEARYDETIPEDQRFQKATPSGRIEMQIDNPAAVAQLVPGKQFYVDFTLVD